MKKKGMTAALLLLSAAFLLGGCGGSSKTVASTETQAVAETAAETKETTVEKEASAEETKEETAAAAQLSDGVYTADFHTDSSMFRVNEACGGKGTLTVKDGQMTIHISLASTHIVNLYPGLAEDAQKEGAVLLEPTVDKVTYSDGLTEEVYGFDVPVPALDTEFDLALIGTKGKWYDHRVSVSDPVLKEDGAAPGEASGKAAAERADGAYTIEVTLEGGSGRAGIDSPAKLMVTDGLMTATLQWSSPNYDYMLVDGEKYLPVNPEGNSVFEIPVAALDEPITVVGDTVAMSTPHEIEYTLTFHSETMKAAE